MLTKDFVKLLNDERKANKNKWVFMGGTVNGKSFKYKAYGTSIQVLEIDNIRHHSTTDVSVKDFKEALENSANYHLPKAV